ncbi:MAG: biosynthetic peptidoglycan transglycosylase [Myxococcales bacterium]|nr:biosynthetic peptidoglycan transglycosylase [Myxococcales bacterium]
MRRAGRIVALAGGGVAAGLGAMAWLWWLPSAVAARIEAAAAAFGMQCTVGDVDLRWAGFVGRDVRVQAAGGALRARVGRIEARASWPTVLGTGARGVEHWSIHDLSVELVVESTGSGDALRRLAERAGSVAPTSGDAASGRGARAPSLDIHDARLRVRDVLGEVVRVEGARASLRVDQVQATAALVRLGAENADVVELRDVEAAWQRTPLALRGLRVGRARVSEAVDQPAATTRERLLALYGSLTRERRGATGGGSEPEGSGLAAGARIELGNLVVERGRERLLDALALRVEARDRDVLHTVGRGRTVTGGHVHWDLLVRRDPARVEGTFEASSLPLAALLPALPDLGWHDAERTRLDASLHVRASGADRIDARGRLGVRDLGFASPRLAARPVGGIDVDIDGEATWWPLQRRIELRSARVSLGRATATLAGHVERTAEGWALALEARLPPTPCQDAVDAIPVDVLEDARGWSLRGQLAGRLSFAVDTRAPDATHVAVAVQDACEVLAIPELADVGRFDGPFEHRVREPDGTWFAMTTGPGTEAWTPLAETSPWLVHAVLAHEDGGFFDHRGFAVWAIERAVARNVREGRFAGGASTITMQLARNVFLHRDKTLARKIQEILLTWWLERVWPKERILELYLNVIEYGPGVYGIRHAARHYFGCEPGALSLAEAAFLATALPSPKTVGTQRARGQISASTRSRMRRLIEHMFSRGRIDAVARDAALADVERFSFDAPRRPQPGRAARLPWEHAAGTLPPPEASAFDAAQSDFEP